MDDLSKQQEGMERLGILAASMVGGMVREGLPPEVAERMAVQIITKVLELSLHAAKAQATDATQQLLNLLRGSGYGAR